MSWSVVQSASDDTAATMTLTFSAGVTSGNFVNIAGLLPAGTYVTGVTDNGSGGSNLYDFVPGGDENAGDNTGGDVVFGVRSHDLITNAPTVLTFTTNIAPVGFFFKCAQEISPPSGTSHVCLDGHTNFMNYSSGTPSSISGTTSSTFTTRNSSVFLWGFVWNSGAALTAGSGWTNSLAGGVADMYTYTSATIAATANNSNAFTFTSNPGGLYGVFWGTAPVAQSSWVPVQQGLATFAAGPVSTMTISLAKAATAGNAIIGGFGAISGGSTVTIQDNLGGTGYSIIVNDTVEGHCIWGSNGRLTTAPSSFTITSSATGAVVGTCVEVQPPTGATTVGVDVSGFTDYFTTPSVATLSTSLTTTKNGDFIYTWISSGASLGDVPQNGLNMLSNWGIKNSDAYIIQSSAGSVTATWDFISSEGIIVLAAALDFTSNAVPAMSFGLSPGIVQKTIAIGY